MKGFLRWIYKYRNVESLLKHKHPRWKLISKTKEIEEMVSLWEIERLHENEITSELKA